MHETRDGSLRLAMDAWCALWFWPLPDDISPEPPSLDEWIGTLEELLGAGGVKKASQGQGMFHEAVDRFDQLSKLDELERQFSGMRPVWQLISRYSWLGKAHDIARENGFFHWELDFATVAWRGGFDLQVGNPPWVRPKWFDNIVLAEYEPHFVTRDSISPKEFADWRESVLGRPALQAHYLGDLATWSANIGFLGSAVEYPKLVGVQTNLYANFMERVWRNAAKGGISGLIHPEGHFNDPNAALLRSCTYPRLRRHWQFVNSMMLFEDIGDTVKFGVHIYGPASEIKFVQISNLIDPTTANVSMECGGEGEVPGIQFPWGGWDLRPHSARRTIIDGAVLEDWAKLFDVAGTPASEARLLRPLTKQHVDVLSVLARQVTRLSDLGYRWTRCFEEDKAKKLGLIEWKTRYPAKWNEVIYQGPHFTVSTPFAKEPNEFCRSKGDYAAWDLEGLPESVLPRTNYQRSCDRSAFDAAIPQWGDRLASDYWRVAWRRMTQPGLERSLHAAIVPPGPVHVDAVHTCIVAPISDATARPFVYPAAAADARNTALTAGLWSTLPFDYLIKVSGVSKVNAELIDRFPAPLGHPASAWLLLRTLRLNCLTRDYAELWNALYANGLRRDSWTAPFAGILGPDFGHGRRAFDLIGP